jgi:hypothetical protein
MPIIKGIYLALKKHSGHNYATKTLFIIRIYDANEKLVAGIRPLE